MMLPSRHPILSTLVVPSANSIPCRNARNASLHYHIWHNASRIALQGQFGIVCIQKSREYVDFRRYTSSSTSTTQAAKGRNIPPLPTNASKTTIPARSKPIQPPTKITQPAPRPSTKPPATTVPALRRPHPPTLASTAPNPKLNPPDFCYAPDLTVPTRHDGQNYFKWLWTAGRAYMTFYKTGASHVRQTAKLAKELRRKVDAQGQNTERYKVLTRAETQIVRRSRRDMYRLPFFGMILLVFGEWTPLLVMYLTPVIPEPCRIPAQVEKAERKAEKYRHGKLEAITRQLQKGGYEFSELKARAEQVQARSGGRSSSKNVDMVTAMTNTDARQVVFDAAGLRAADPGKMSILALNHFVYRFGGGLMLWHTVPSLLVSKVRSMMEYVKRDDELIGRDGGWRALNRPEMRRVAKERGIDVVGKSEEEIRKEVAVWYGAK